MTCGRVNSSLRSSWAARVGNVRVAAARLGRVWTKGVSSEAARSFAALWPIWTGGILLFVACGIGLDTASVTLVRGLPAPLIGFFQWLTDFGKSGWLLYPSGLLCLVLLFSDWDGVNRRVAAAWTEIGLICGFAFISIAGTGVVMNVMKQIIGRGRPVVFDRDGAFSLMPFQFDYAQASFPSGHATTMGALAAVIAAIVPRARWPAFLACGLIASSRVFVAAHYPSDVVAGFLLGGALTWYYALALSAAGVVFLQKTDGVIRTRAVAIRHMSRQPGGFSIAMGSLWLAIFGVGVTVRTRDTKLV